MKTYEAIIKRIDAALRDADLEEHNLDYLLDVLPDHFDFIRAEGYSAGVEMERTGRKNEDWNQVVEARDILSAIGLTNEITDNDNFIESGSVEDVFYQAVGEIFSKGCDEGAWDC